VKPSVPRLAGAHEPNLRLRVRWFAGLRMTTSMRAPAFANVQRSQLRDTTTRLKRCAAVRAQP